MSFIDLPGYAEALKDDFRVLEEADNGMGDTVGLIKEYLEDELESHASDMGLEEEYRDREHEVLVSPDEEVAVLYGEFYRESKIALLGADVWLCEKTNSSDHRGRTSGKREYRAPSNGGHVYVDESSLRAYDSFLNQKKPE